MKGGDARSAGNVIAVENRGRGSTATCEVGSIGAGGELELRHADDRLIAKPTAQIFAYDTLFWFSMDFYASSSCQISRKSQFGLKSVFKYK